MCRSRRQRFERRRQTATTSISQPRRPYALACGGTSLQASGDSITSEKVWNDGAAGGATGGGISKGFAAPPCQEGLSAALTKGGSTRADQTRRARCGR